MNILETFGNIVRSRRKDNKLTQEQLAEKCDLSTRHISSIENGVANPKLDTVINLCNVCNINVGDLNIKKEGEEK